ncbi:MAG: hypothetical protein ACEPOW_07435 [Bacteroidales bacterium]
MDLEKIKKQISLNISSIAAINEIINKKDYKISHIDLDLLMEKTRVVYDLLIQLKINEKDSSASASNFIEKQKEIVKSFSKPTRETPSYTEPKKDFSTFNNSTEEEPKKTTSQEEEVKEAVEMPNVFSPIPDEKKEGKYSAPTTNPIETPIQSSQPKEEPKTSNIFNKPENTAPFQKEDIERKYNTPAPRKENETQNSFQAPKQDKPAFSRPEPIAPKAEPITPKTEPTERPINTNSFNKTPENTSFAQPKASPISPKPESNGNNVNSNSHNSQFTSPASIAERFLQSEDNSIAARFQTASTQSLIKGIGLNERLLFIRVLFNSKVETYEHFIQELDSLSSYEGAMTFYSEMKVRYNWMQETEAHKKLIELIERKFQIS